MVKHAELTLIDCCWLLLPMEFGMPPNILEVTDSSQILSFVVAKQALEDSGYGQSGECDHTRTGVIRRHQTEVWCWPNTYQDYSITDNPC
ncbi:MAG: hypothetical protein GY801_17860 [bacterium]|nr:hypothetical protein [bacterium]